MLLAVLFVVLVIPYRIEWITAESFLRIPIEFPLLLILLLIPTHLGLFLRWIAATLLALGLLFKLADMACFQIFARPFNPIFDAYLLGNGIHLLKGALGSFAGVAVGAFLLALTAFIVCAMFWLLHILHRHLHRYRMKVLSLAFVLSVVWGGLILMQSRYANHHFYDVLKMHIVGVTESMADMQSFNAQLQTLHANSPAAPQFARLAGRDVLIIFVESYGRTLLDNPEFSRHIVPLMNAQQQRLRDAGVAVRTGYLTSPTMGGLSWLAHGTAMSGLWINNQIRYDSLMMSEHPSLNRLFSDAGWRSVAVMPAISMAWPEGAYFGYDHLYDAYNMGYQGKPFNWVTMPDQYTLSAFHQRELSAAVRNPVMAEIALISSHAPWTPVPSLVEWDTVGDGTVFNAQAVSGDSPEVVWKDASRVRLQYRLASEYALTTWVDYVIRFAPDNALIIVLGDHQPAPLVTGPTDNRDVPFHVLSKDATLIEQLSEWRLTEGLVPEDHGPVWPMNALTSRLIETFSVEQRSSREQLSFD